MRWWALISSFGAVLGLCGTAFAANPPNATVQAECAGKPGSQVALKWSDSTMKLFTVKCGQPGTMPAPTSAPPVVLQGPKSTIEVQTEGGIETSYVVTVTIDSQKPPLNNYFILEHYGSPSTTADQVGYRMKRTAGPNKYGEQNFAIHLNDTQPRTDHRRQDAQLDASATGIGDHSVPTERLQLLGGRHAGRHLGPHSLAKACPSK